MNETLKETIRKIHTQIKSFSAWLFEKAKTVAQLLMKEISLLFLGGGMELLKYYVINNRKDIKIRYKQYEKMGGISQATFSRLIANSNGIKRG